jgi:transcriptional regulator with XRE-family HTH domain
MIGRPSKYDPGIHTQLVYWMAKNGLTDIKIAEALHISKATLNNWKNKHSDFLDSIKQGKDLVDTLVEGSLLKRALGFEYIETTKTRNEEGKLKTTKKVTKYTPGDVAAQFIWLKNRKPDEWRDKKEIAINSNMEKLFESLGQI